MESDIRKILSSEINGFSTSLSNGTVVNKDILPEQKDGYALSIYIYRFSKLYRIGNVKKIREAQAVLF